MSKINWVTRACVVFPLWATAAIALPAQTTAVAPKVKFTIVYSFTNGTDGAYPGALIQASDGHLYGVAGFIAFKMTPGGTLTPMDNILTVGVNPDGALVQATNGDFYGEAEFDGTGGPFNNNGTIYKFTHDGALASVHIFDYTDGEWPDGGLTQGPGGNFYGSTLEGGITSNKCYEGCGTIFKITPGGSLTTLHKFDFHDGEWPSGLALGTDGNFYGTTIYGGPPNQVKGFGTVFQITPGGTFTTIYYFCLQDPCTDGIEPGQGLVQGTDGNLYGTTLGGGTYGAGTVFKITPGGMLTTLYNFCSQTYHGSCTDGLAANRLVQAADGSFYGTTYEGGTSANCIISEGCGTVFKITPTGALTTLYNICSQTNCTDGFKPVGGLIQDTDGSFYGTTGEGGTSRACEFGCGTVFRVDAGLGPFVEMQPTSGKVGEPVKILGTNFVGATSVTFNGTPAAFTMVSKTLLRTTVPAGATTGTVEVSGPDHSLSSNVPFTVKH